MGSGMQANRPGKTQIAEDIITMVNESGGRFLKKDNNVRLHVFMMVCVRVCVMHRAPQRRGIVFPPAPI